MKYLWGLTFVRGGKGEVWGGEERGGEVGKWEEGGGTGERGVVGLAGGRGVGKEGKGKRWGGGEGERD